MSGSGGADHRNCGAPQLLYPITRETSCCMMFTAGRCVRKNASRRSFTFLISDIAPVKKPGSLSGRRWRPPPGATKVFEKIEDWLGVRPDRTKVLHSSSMFGVQTTRHVHVQDLSPGGKSLVTLVIEF